MQQIFKNNLLKVAVYAFLILIIAGCGDNDTGADVSKYPERSLDLIVAFAPGGDNDNIARILADTSEEFIGESIIVENRTGGSGTVGQTAGANADPDGYTLTLITSSIVSNPMLNDLTYTHESFEPVILLNNEDLFLVTSEDSSFDDFDSFLQYAEDNPGKVNIGASGSQTITAFAANDMADAAGIDITIVPHEGVSDAIVSLQGGHIDAIVGTYGEIRDQISNSGFKPILTLTQGDRNPNTPDVPTAAEVGIDIEYTSWRGIGVPADTDPEVVKYLHDKIKETMESQDYQDRMETVGIDINYADTDSFRELINTTYENYSNNLEK